MEQTFEVDILGNHIVAYSSIQGDQLIPGDLYIAKRNTGWQLAKCKYVNKAGGWVMPDPPMLFYSYDCNECFKVKEIDIVAGCGSMVYRADNYVCPYFSRPAEWKIKHGNIGPCGIDLQVGTNRCLYALLDANID